MMHAMEKVCLVQYGNPAAVYQTWCLSQSELRSQNDMEIYYGYNITTSFNITISSF